MESIKSIVEEIQSNIAPIMASIHEKLQPFLETLSLYNISVLFVISACITLVALRSLRSKFVDECVEFVLSRSLMENKWLFHAFLFQRLIIF